MFKVLLKIINVTNLPHTKTFLENFRILDIQDAQDPPKMYLIRFGGPHTKMFQRQKIYLSKNEAHLKRSLQNF